MSTIKVFISNYDVLHSGQGGVKNVHTVHFLLSTSYATLLVPIEDVLIREYNPKDMGMYSRQQK